MNSTLYFKESLKPNISLLVQNVRTISPQLAYRHAPLPSCPHSPGLTQSGLRAKADRLLEGQPAPIWNITGSELQLPPVPEAVLFVLEVTRILEDFDGGTETHLKKEKKKKKSWSLSARSVHMEDA